MAKPKPLSSSPSPATSKRIQTSSTRKQTPRGLRQRTHSSTPAPSPSLLAFLATLTVSSSSALGYPLEAQPLPPDFLCPGLGPDLPPTPPVPVQASSSRRRERRAISDHPSQSQIKPKLKRSTFVPDKYIQGADGRWRQSSNWSLYGYCNCDTAPTEYATVPDIAENDVQATPTASDLYTPTMGADQLPPGWSSKSSEDTILTYIILALSLLLAVVICIFMVGCIAWRKKQKLLTQKDLEKKSRSPSRLDYDSEEESHETRQAKKQQRLWARASARWKANVRLSARRRRAQRTISSVSSVAQASRTSLHSTATSSSVNPHTRSVGDVSDSRSDRISPQVSRESDEQQQPQRSSSTEVESPRIGIHSRPPSYLRNSLSDIPPVTDASGRLPPSESVGPSAPQLSISRKALDDAHAQSDPSHDEEAPPPGPYEAPADAAHVATDDKSVLARMAAMASAPPMDRNSDASLHDGESSGPSVPVLEYELEEYEDHPDLTQSGPSSDSAAAMLPPPPPHSLSLPAPSYSRDPDDPSTEHPLFPSPPSKSALAAPTFYEYPASFEQDMLMIMDTEPTMEPSAPPFEFGEVTPSAPPLLPDGEDVEHSEVLPSAPPISETLDDVSASAPPLQDSREDSLSSPGHASPSLSPSPSTPPSASAPASSASSLPGYLP